MPVCLLVLLAVAGTLAFGLDASPQAIKTLSNASPSSLTPVAQVPVVPPDARKDAYEFASALVEGMDRYIDAEEKLSRAASAPLKSASAAVELLAALRTAQLAWRTGQSLLARFGTSRDTVLAELAALLAKSYGLMSDVYGRKVALVETMIKEPNVNMGAVTIEMGKLVAQSDQGSHSMARLTAEGATTVLEDLSREDERGQVAYLKLTRAEKNEILRRLGTLAGPAPSDTTLDESRSQSRIPALSVWRWLHEGWRCSDEK